MIGAEALLKVKAAMVGHSRYPLSYIQAMMRPPDRRLQYRWSVVDLPRPTTLEVEEMRDVSESKVLMKQVRSPSRLLQRGARLEKKSGRVKWVDAFTE